MAARVVCARATGDLDRDTTSVIGKASGTRMKQDSGVCVEGQNHGLLAGRCVHGTRLCLGAGMVCVCVCVGIS